MKSKTTHELRDEIERLKKELAAALAYKQLARTVLANKKLNPKIIIDGMRFAVRCIESDDLELARRVAGSSGDLAVRGRCSICGINLVGANNPRPRKETLPCNLFGCSYERERTTVEIENDEAAWLTLVS